VNNSEIEEAEGKEEDHFACIRSFAFEQQQSC
jgi:hypothetical protein